MFERSGCSSRNAGLFRLPVLLAFSLVPLAASCDGESAVGTARIEQTSLVPAPALAPVLAPDPLLAPDPAPTGGPLPDAAPPPAELPVAAPVPPVRPPPPCAVCEITCDNTTGSYKVQMSGRGAGACPPVGMELGYYTGGLVTYCQDVATSRFLQDATCVGGPYPTEVR